MITVPTIYTDNEGQVASDLSIPSRRQSIWLNFLTALLYPQTWLNNLVFNKWFSGSGASLWTSGSTYVYGDNVKGADYAVYECINLNGVTSTTPPYSDPTNWQRICDTFVGVGERAMYTGQLGMLEYILNYYFGIGTVTLPWTGASHSTQIYIVNNNGTYGNTFWLTNSNTALTSFMAQGSSFQRSYMRNSSSGLNANNFTIYVPTAYSAYQSQITSLASKYCQANYSFNIILY